MLDQGEGSDERDDAWDTRIRHIEQGNVQVEAGLVLGERLCLAHLLCEEDFDGE